MTSQTRIATVLLSMVVVALCISPAGARAADDNDNSAGKKKAPVPTVSTARPDLKIEYDGFAIPANTQIIRFKVTNIGQARSSAIKAKIVTIEPEPTPSLGEPDVPALTPGASATIQYSFAAPCNGHRVRAAVDDPLDFNSTNDSAELQVCTAAPKNPNLDSSRIISSGLSAIPDHMQKGEHYLEIPASVVRRNTTRRFIGYVKCQYPDPSPYNWVGFDHETGPGCNDESYFYFIDVNQMVVDFDLQWLRDIEQKLVFRAELRFDELAIYARNPATGDYYQADTCIELGLAPAGYEDSIDHFRLIEGPEAGESKLNTGWLVTRDIQFALRPDAEFKGFLLRGFDERLDVMDHGACGSEPQKFRLWLHYSVL